MKQSCAPDRIDWGNPAPNTGLTGQSCAQHRIARPAAGGRVGSKLRESILQLCRTTSVWSEVGFPTSVEMARSDRSRGAGLAFPMVRRTSQISTVARQPAELPTLPGLLAICAICAIWVLHANPLNSHTARAPCYMCYMCYMGLTRQPAELPHCPGSLLYVLYVLYGSYTPTR